MSRAFDEKNLPYERNGSMDGKSIICAISQPSEQSDTFYASSKLKAPWSTKRKMVNENNVAQSDYVDFAWYCENISCTLRYGKSDLCRVPCGMLRM